MNKKLVGILILIVLAIGGYFYLNNSGAKPPQEQETTGEITVDTTQVPVGYIDVSPEETKNLIAENPNLIIIDVSPNYDQGHLPGAINYYVGDGSLEKAIPNLDKDAVYLVYCHVDSASIQGAQALIDAGFTNVYRLKGNYAAWIEAGYEIEK
jgi:rhodanese-related sulfurtransferase